MEDDPVRLSRGFRYFLGFFRRAIQDLHSPRGDFYRVIVVAAPDRLVHIATKACAKIGVPKMPQGVTTT